MPWSDSPDYQRPVRLRDVLGIVGLLLILLIGYELIPARLATGRRLQPLPGGADHVRPVTATEIAAVSD